jgi:hypothetical protein
MDDMGTDRRRFSDEDILALEKILDARMEKHFCRFQGITVDRLQAAVKLTEHIESLLSETGTTVRKTLIVAGVGGLLTLLILGLYAKIKQGIGIP